MDDETRCRYPAQAHYRELIESDDLTDLDLHRELMLREEGDRLNRILDEGGIGYEDPSRLEVAALIQELRRLFIRLEVNLVEDGSDLLESDPN